jgi:feruloyl esterase
MTILAATLVACANLASLTLPNTTITAAESIPAGGFTPPRPSRAIDVLPAFCRVAATLKPSSDSEIKIEVWLPESNWNGKFQGVGNGGWSGAISYPSLAVALRQGYATASTDTGHVGGRGEFALGHPEKLTDFAWRAVHEMTVQAKAIVAEYYGSGPRLSYWSGCSSGGKQGLKEAQKFSADYDGIVAGAPANFWTHLSAGLIAIAQATLKDPASSIPPAKYAVINKAVLDACDATDGVKDGVIENPAACHFDPKALQCSGEDQPTCLTPPQVAAAKTIYAPSRNPSTGEQIFPGLAPGSELGWGAAAGGPGPLQIPDDHFKYVVFKDPNWDFRTFDLGRDVSVADRIDAGALNATDPNLKTFFGRGGKLLMYHGWSDQLISPQNSINYYQSVVSAVGAKTADESVRLFMVPGMMHCGGGPGPGTFDAVEALDRWIEKKQPPTQLAASHMSNGVTDRTRPLCPYPQVAGYKGTGSTDEAANFECRTSPR